MEQTSEAAISNLLNRTSQIRQKHELVAELTGENFNVFRILGLQASENRTHSAFLRELLDPRGTHGMGDAFLKAFIRMLRSKISHVEALRMDQLIEELQIAAEVVTELHLGYKSEDLTKGGRVDLAIKLLASGWSIFIENKIYAGDQECQLLRYKNEDSNALLLYLTLDGDDASEYSTENPVSGDKLESGVDYFPISYGGQILTWLEDCAKEASSRPLVRETIVQYAHLIRYLTHQNSSNLMTQDITKMVLSGKEAFLAFKAIQHSDSEIKVAIIEVVNSQMRNLAAEFGFEFSSGLDAAGKKETGFNFTSPQWNAFGIDIGFMCHYPWLKDWCFGIGASADIIASSPIAPDLIVDLNRRFRVEFPSGNEPNECWIANSCWLDYSSWDDPDTLASIVFGSFVEDVRVIVRKILVICRDAGLPGDYRVLNVE